MPNLVLVHGTWARAHPWHLPGSTLCAEAEARGFIVHDFLWDGALAGVPTELPGGPLERANGADRGPLLPWLSSGEKLVLQLQAWGINGDESLCLLSHSHGLQVGAFAIVRGMRLRRWVSVSGPVRADMQRARRIARDGVERWVQYGDPTGDDRTIIAGEIEFGMPHAIAFDLPEGVTVHTPGSGHSGLVDDAALRAKYSLWEAFV